MGGPRRETAGDDWPDLERLFGPKVIAVIGASPTREKAGGRPLQYLDDLGFAGRVLAVNPAYTTLGERPCYPSVGAIPAEVGGDEIDVALIAVRADRVPAAIRDCGTRGVRFAVVFTAGFAETGAAGARAERELLATARAAGVRVVGPNSLGVVGVAERAIATFATSFEGLDHLHDGSVGFVTQSGALGAFVFRAAHEQRLGLRHAVSTGNEGDLDFADYVAHFAADPGTRLIAGYLEGVSDGPKLLAALDLARRAGKPVCLLKVGRSELGREAALSHTGSLTGSDALYDAVFAQTGVVRVDTLQDLLDVAGLWSMVERPDPARGVAIASVSGGLGVWMADAFADGGVRLSRLDGAPADELRAVLPDFARVGNPIDFTGQIVSNPELLRASLQAVVKHEDVGVLVIGLGLQHWQGTRLADDIIAAVHGSGVLPVVAWMAGPAEANERLRAAGVPVFDEFGRAVRAVTHVVRCAEALADAPVGPPPAVMARNGVGTGASRPERVMGEAQAKQLLATWGIAVPVGREVAATVEAAVAAARDVGYPLVLKGLVETNTHKSERGMVRVGLGDDAALSGAAAGMLSPFDRSADDLPSRLLVEQMVPAGVEVILSVVDHPIFGLSTMIGAGGVLTELTVDVAHHVGPLDSDAAVALIARTRVARLLAGFRGAPPSDVDALADAAVALSAAVASSGGGIREVEINPIVVGPRGAGAVAVDAVVRVAVGDAVPVRPDEPVDEEPTR